MVTGKMVNGTMDEEKKQEGQGLHQVFSQLDVILAGIALTVLALLGSPFIIAAVIKAGEFSALPPYTWILTTASVYVCAVPYLAALIELKLICSRIFTDKAGTESVIGTDK